MAAGDGLISMTPTSIAYSGTSASINADGGVDFTAVTSLSLNGVFTSDYDNYLVVIQNTSSVGGSGLITLRSSGTDATGSDYTRQDLIANDVTVSAERQTSQTNWERLINFDATAANGFHIHWYGPALAQPTAVRSVSVRSALGALIRDVAGTHSLSTSYDGFTFTTTASNITGNIHVFGYEE